MTHNGWVQIPVTEWMNDGEEKFSTAFGELTNLEWLQREKRRLEKSAPHSRPFIRIHPNYFDKDSHGRSVYKQIALFRFVPPAQIEKELVSRVNVAIEFSFEQPATAASHAGASDLMQSIDAA